ncbi:hypothetical protein COE01_17815 [Bacillus thuringiensis]|uniref:Uncharacterized protein n=2 Tax=Bacillus cereus group TaxID=86661 RepID=A0AAW7NFZ6_BACCE|nr:MULTISPECIES: hypothetical protein [Bacillus]ATI60378.1 hypothetical protein CPZ31_15890 [Bacillus cereus]KXX92289.1 hypothetical protein AT266_06140 [Bacillus cereus]MBG9748532.1 hypothetical protein [Bacillus thuringiensis]MBG9749464.1 hypothetical protein [Bacillus thuringiensis]MBG9778309.1 hypothetical protein [Bacillus thuringiensis]
MAKRYGSLKDVLELPWSFLIDLYMTVTDKAIEYDMRWDAYINNPFRDKSFSDYLIETGYRDRGNKYKKETIPVEQVMKNARELSKQFRRE